ncbi:MAG: rhodanese-like domain-containing protein [Bacteroidetes bacterium]|nr:rhodanese-like domain-containing protein [Bacteroidota bacterium]MBU1116258.1 rhodanese-like domain-containing protein [Bacteroidota bacterium]MBU1799756.1 rhodanese-like domain-containing protein [Bacteroidota bacterium]
MKNKYIIIIFATILLLSAYIFSQSTGKSEISIADLIVQLESEEKPILLDVRNPNELKGELGHIYNAINIPVHELEGRLSELADYKAKKIFVICRSGNRSRYATALLNKAGFNASNVKGGMIEYHKVKK